MFGLGTQELIIIFLIILLVFGAAKLPQIGKALGKAIREFKKAGKELKDDSDQERENDLKEGSDEET